MREAYDVIVVGAGPGGSIAARTAAKDCDVLLIEKRQEVGAPVRCAEGVAKQTVLKYIKPNDAWIASKPHKARIFAPDGTVLQVSGEAIGIQGEVAYILERKVFDRELAKDAARAGAHVVVRTRATGLIKDNGTITGVKLNRLGEDFEVRSKVVIGADGVESQVGRWGGINTTLKLKDIGTCVQYQMTNVDKSADTIDVYFGSAAPGGYVWAYPKDERTANVGLGVLASKLNGKRPIDYLNEFVSKNFSAAQPVELVMGGVPVSEELKRTVENGLMLVGDAARHCDPLTGGGITNAMEGGRIAGEVASKAVQQNDASVKVLKAYEVEWHASYGKMQKHSYKIKEFLTSQTDEELNKLIKALKGIQPQEMSILDITKRLLTANPKLVLLMRHLSALREMAPHTSNE
jgi:digeranylgeranylglycerophospholipid reductase